MPISCPVFSLFFSSQPVLSLFSIFSIPYFPLPSLSYPLINLLPPFFSSFSFSSSFLFYSPPFSFSCPIFSSPPVFSAFSIPSFPPSSRSFSYALLNLLPYFIPFSSFFLLYSFLPNFPLSSLFWPCLVPYLYLITCLLCLLVLLHPSRHSVSLTSALKHTSAGTLSVHTAVGRFLRSLPCSSWGYCYLLGQCTTSP